MNETTIEHGPRFHLRTLLWTCAFVAVGCKLVAVVTGRTDASFFYLAFGISLLLIGAFILVESQFHVLRPMSLSAAAAIVAVSTVVYMRGRLPMVMLVGPIKLGTDLSEFARSSAGCALTAIGFVAFVGTAVGSCWLLFSPYRKVAVAAIILLLLWLALLSIGADRRPSENEPSDSDMTRYLMSESRLVTLRIAAGISPSLGENRSWHTR